MMNMSLIDTLEYFIDDTRARLSDVEWKIRDEEFARLKKGPMGTVLEDDETTT